MEKPHQIKITLQSDIYEQVKNNSKENMRTLSAEINFMLKKAYAGGVNTPDTTTDTDIDNDTINTMKINTIKRNGDLW